MGSIARGFTMYLFLLLIFRLSGKRTLAQATTFDLVLLLIISEVTQEAMIADDHSMTNAMTLIMTLIGTAILMAWLKQVFPKIDRLIEGEPIIVVEHGRLLHDRMKKERVDERDLLEAARTLYGLERLDQIKYAIIERNGDISIVPTEEAR